MPKDAIIARETACLSVQDRRLVDEELVGQLPTLSDRQAAHAAARIAHRLETIDAEISLAF